MYDLSTVSQKLTSWSRAPFFTASVKTEAIELSFDEGLIFLIAHLEQVECFRPFVIIAIDHEAIREEFFEDFDLRFFVSGESFREHGFMHAVFATLDLLEELVSVLLAKIHFFEEREELIQMAGAFRSRF